MGEYSRRSEGYKVMIRSYDGEKDSTRVEQLERRCEVGPNHKAFLFTDTLGDPICRIRNSPFYTMLVAELGTDLAGVIQGSIKVVTLDKTPRDQVKMGYVLGLRVCPLHRRAGVGSSLVRALEEWFRVHGADYAYMATEKDNEASVQLFVHRLGYVPFRTPTILVNPVGNRLKRIPCRVEIKKIQVEDAESAYKRFMGSTDFFPTDIDCILRNRLSLGTWVAYYKEGAEGSSSETPCDASSGFTGAPGSRDWAMVSVWNSSEVFKLRLGNAPLSCTIYTKGSRLMDRFFPCFKSFPSIPDFFDPFGFFFIYGVHCEGPRSGKLVRSLCNFVHNMAASSSKDCKAIVTEVGGGDRVRLHIPHWKLLSCPEDLWCLKAMKSEERDNLLHLTSTMSTTRVLFVDPREV